MSLRRLENEVVSELMGGEMVFGFDGEHSPIKVSINQLAAYGFDVKAMSEASCVAELMRRYRELTEK